jgi:hypothetical protein
MAVPEIGIVKIVPDFFNYNLSISNTITLSTLEVATGSNLYTMFDHNATTKTTITESDANLTGSTTDGTLTSNVISNISKKYMLVVDGHTLSSADGKLAIYDGSSATASVAIAGSDIFSSNFMNPNTDNQICVIETTGYHNDVTGVAINDGGTWDTSSVDIGILHLGPIFEMPTTPSDISINTNNFNKISNSVSGRSYSTLYNTNRQREINMSWDYIKWDDGTESGISTLSDILKYTQGSHIPVVLQLSQDSVPKGTATQPTAIDWFMYARITKWEQSQISPNAWSVSATFTEIV